MTEKQDLPISPAQVRMARAALDWSLDDLAQASGIGRATIHRFENGGESVKASTVEALRATLEQHKVTFFADGPMKGAVQWRDG